MTHRFDGFGVPVVFERKGPQLFGPFILERRIAIGGSAEVYLARPRTGSSPASELVIKRLLSGSDREEHFETLSREAELHRAVRHENVVTVFGAGMVGGEPYLAMEYVDGVDLHRLSRLAASENRAIPTFLSVYIAHAVARALHAVHDARDDREVRFGIIHGDVSPSNVYLSSRGEVKLGDFGIAHAARGLSPDRSSSVKGKFGYLAPEQLEGEPADQRSDIFALGVVLGEMLIGEKIFPGQGQLAILLSVRESNIEPLRRAEARLPPALFKTCVRALARNPDHRFADAGAMAKSLEPLLEADRARKELARWVRWARDDSGFAREFEKRVRFASGANRTASTLAAPPEPTATSSVRRDNVVIRRDLTFPSLLELAATGHLELDDEVSLLGAPFRRVHAIDELARYLMPSTTATTGQLFQPGAPDYAVELREVSMLGVLARMRMRRESGALFVARTNRKGVPDRKDMYLASGRLVHVASSDREELLGQYALRLELIDQAELDLALANLRSFGGRLGDTLIGLGLAEPAAIFRAIRNQGRDRVASLCTWREGRVQLYRGADAEHVQFPLDLDLTVPMMAGAMLLARQGDRSLERFSRLHPGRRFAEAEAAGETAEVPQSLLALFRSIRPGLPVTEAISDVMQAGTQARPFSEQEARAAMRVALELEWARAD